MRAFPPCGVAARLDEWRDVRRQHLPAHYAREDHAFEAPCHNADVGRHEIDDVRDHADAMKRLLRGVIVAGPALRDDDDAPIGRHRAVERAFGLAALNEDRRDHMRKQHDVSKR